MKLPDHILEKLVTEIMYQGRSIDTSRGDGESTGKRKIPRVFFLGQDVIDKINNYGLKTNGEKHIKLLSQGKKTYMFFSPLFYNAIKGVERGRSSYEKEWRKPELMKLITDIIPGPVRGKIKKKVSPSIDPRLKMHNVGFPYMVPNKDQTGYWVPAMDKKSDEFEQLVTGLYENKMKKSTLRKLIKEELRYVLREDGRLRNMKASDVIKGRKKFTEKRSKSGNVGVIVKIANSLGFTELEKHRLKTQLYNDEIDIEQAKDKQMLKQVLKLYRNVNEDALDKIEDMGMSIGENAREVMEMFNRAIAARV